MLHLFVWVNVKEHMDIFNHNSINMKYWTECTFISLITTPHQINRQWARNTESIRNIFFLMFPLWKHYNVQKSCLIQTITETHTACLQLYYSKYVAVFFLLPCWLFCKSQWTCNNANLSLHLVILHQVFKVRLNAWKQLGFEFFL